MGSLIISRARSDCGDGSVRSKLATAFPCRWSSLRSGEREHCGSSHLDRRLGIPDAILRASELFENREVLIPGDLCKHRLHNASLGQALSERPHVLQVAGRKSLHVREARLRSAAKRSMTFAPQLYRSCLSRMS